MSYNHPQSQNGNGGASYVIAQPAQPEPQVCLVEEDCQSVVTNCFHLQHGSR